MNAATLFALGNSVALVGWLYLIVAGRWTPRILGCVRIGLPLTLSVAYLLSLTLALPTAEGGFGSIGAVRLLFANDWALAAGWIHYLAFDFLVGCWMLEKAKAERLTHLLVIPVLLVTFLAGPAGYLIFQCIRGGRRRMPGSQAPLSLTQTWQ